MVRRFTIRLCGLLVVVTILTAGSVKMALGGVYSNDQRAVRMSGRSRDSSIYVATDGNSDIIVIDAQGKIKTKFAARYASSVLAADRKGNVYVSGPAVTNSVQVFHAPRYFQTTLSLPQGQQAQWVIADPRSGLVAIVSSAPQGDGEVTFFRSGASKPCRVVHPGSSGFIFSGGGGFDHAGTLYTEVKTEGAGDLIVSIEGGCSRGPLTALKFSEAFLPALAFGFNKNDDLVVHAIISPTNQPLLTAKLADLV